LINAFIFCWTSKDDRSWILFEKYLPSRRKYIMEGNPNSRFKLRYGVPIWSLWPNIRFLPSIVAEKNATRNGHIQNVCSMCIKINKVGKQEVGFLNPSDSYFLFAEERGYHKWALAHSSSCCFSPLWCGGIQLNLNVRKHLFHGQLS
jgi:hypothetical protein